MTIFSQGETVPYIICWECDDDGQPIKATTKTQAERAYHLDEVRDNPKLTVDTDYYLESQVKDCLYIHCNWQQRHVASCAEPLGQCLTSLRSCID